MRGERKLATINSKNQFERRWFFGGRKPPAARPETTEPRSRQRVMAVSFFSLLPSLAAAPFSPTKEFPSDAVLYRPPKIYDRHRESRILRNNSIVARRPRLPPRTIPLRNYKPRLPLPPIINVVFENVFENSSNFIATVNRTIRSTFVIITFDSLPRREGNSRAPSSEGRPRTTFRPAISATIVSSPYLRLLRLSVPRLRPPPVPVYTHIAENYILSVVKGAS